MQIHSKLFDIIDKFANYTVLVVGDIILDEYIWGKATRLSPEAPVPVLDVSKYSYIAGGAANVANNIAFLGGKTLLLGVVGEDDYAGKLAKSFKNNNVDCSGLIVDSSRPTTVKTRLIATNHQQLARADRESKESISVSIQYEILKKIEQSVDKVDLILLSDYAKGVLTPELTKSIIDLANKYGKVTLVDPKGLDYTKYENATLITPNRLEAETATKSPSGTNPEELATLISEQVNISNILVTLGEDGIFLCADNKFKLFPAVTSEVYDVTGAGDSLISGIALGLPASAFDIETAVVIGNYAAGVAVRKTGTTVVSPMELKHIIEHDLIDKQEMNSGTGN